MTRWQVHERRSDEETGGTRSSERGTGTHDEYCLIECRTSLLSRAAEDAFACVRDLIGRPVECLQRAYDRVGEEEEEKKG